MLIRSEFSFREAFGPMGEVLKRLPPWGGILADWGTWGHVGFAGPSRVLGTRITLASNLESPERGPDIVIVPRSPSGLKALYEAVTLAYAQFYRVPRLTPDQLTGQDWDLLTFTPGIPGTRWVWRPGDRQGGQELASCDNYYCSPEDRRAWLLMAGRMARGRPGPQHILSEQQLLMEGALSRQIDAMRELIAGCNTPLPKAQNIKFGVDDPDAELRRACESALRARPEGSRMEYWERLDRELLLIADKKFADYFLVIADMIQYAKQHMLVGPARGSSAGSLVCWLTRITEIDPLRFDLLFERFVDANRFDLPDIDIDFPDEKRHVVMEYLAHRYDAPNVAHIGTVLRFKAKSALATVAKELEVPLFELDKLKDVLIERSSGDSRAGQCLEDSMLEREIGRQLLARYPGLDAAFRLEMHAFSSGVHAAGIIVCNEKVSNYCSIGRDHGAQIDKKMAEKLNMLKIDALGLRTLTVIETACELAGIQAHELYSVDLEDRDAFKVLNDRHYSGIFQFEGIALQSVANQFTIDCFDDIASITALARPGPLAGGETTRWVERKAGREPIQYAHPLLEPYCRGTLGCIIYQEQVMQITRNVGNFSWADTAAIRKLMSSREGDEKFQRFEEAFIGGAISNGVPEKDARKIWKAINTFGSWAFNKSHAVAYGLLSYWTAWLKAHHPLPYVVAALRHARDDDGAMLLLREVLREGQIEYVPLDAVHSEATWSYKDGKLYGGFTAVKGCGAKTAREICLRRREGIKFTAQQKKIVGGVSKFADPFPAHALWGDLYDRPQEHFRTIERLDEVSELETGHPDRVALVGKLVKKNLRDLNEERYVVRRGGKRLPEDKKDMLLFHIEDDTGRMLCCIRAEKYHKIGSRIVEHAAIGDWFVVVGRIGKTFLMLEVEAVRWLKIPSSDTLSKE